MMSNLSRAADLGRYERNIRRFYAYKFLMNFQLWLPIWILYLQRSRGLSLTQITSLDAPFWLLIVLAEAPTGAVADRWGRRRSLLLGALVYSAAIFLFGVGRTYWELLIAYLVWGVAQTLGSGADTAFLFENLRALGREGEFRKALGRVQAFESGAALIAALIGAPLAAATTLSFPIVLSAGIALLAALVVLRMREPPGAPGERPAYFGIMREAVLYTVRHRSLRAMILLRAVILGLGLAISLFTQPFLAEQGVPVAGFGLLLTPMRLLAIGGALTAYRVAHRTGEKRLYLGAGVMMVAAMLLLAAIPHLAVFPMFAVVSLVVVTFGPVSNDFVNRHSPAHLRATISSLGQMAFSLVLAIFEPLMGFIADRSSLTGMFFTAAVATASLGGGAFLLWVAAVRDDPAVASLPVAAGSG